MFSVVFVCLSVCLSASNSTLLLENYEWIAMKFYGGVRVVI